MHRLVLLVPALAASLLGGCSHSAPRERSLAEPAATAEARSPIVHGDADTIHDAVVALLGPYHACSGTIVATRPPDLYVLTAAHCVAPVAPSDPEIVAIGPDYERPDASFAIEDCQPHPDYDGEVRDFAMCRAVGADEDTPFIEAQAEADGLAPGTSVLHVGYGTTGPGRPNSLRLAVLGELDAVDELLLWYAQAEAGPCAGDSGGPQLSTRSPERVVGVSSFGDESCNVYGASGRVAAVYASFIEPYLQASPSEAGADGAGGTGPDGPAAGAAGRDEPGSKDDVPGSAGDSLEQRVDGPPGACATAQGVSSGPIAARSLAALVSALALVQGVRRRLRPGRAAGTAARERRG
jgi:hypothetical protein